MIEVSWDQARHSCRCQHGGDLVSVTSAEESEWLFSGPMTVVTDNAWIGLREGFKNKKLMKLYSYGLPFCFCLNYFFNLPQ